jgi:hypothetical protein
MDAPPEGVTSVVLFVASMAVHVDDKSKTASDDVPKEGKKWRVLTVGKAIDLVAHEGEDAAAVLGQLELPEGKITQIRLALDTEEPQTATVDGAICDLDVSKVAPEGVRISHVFKAFESKAGREIDVFVDLELDKSLKEADGCFRLEPVLKLHKVTIDGKDAPI